MKARDFIIYAGLEEECEKALYYLGQYVGKGDHYVCFPDSDVLTEDGFPLEDAGEEPAGFQDYYEQNTANR